MTQAPQPPAGWYTDPDDSSQQRYWDGGAWTAHAAGATSSTPVVNVAAKNHLGRNIAFGAVAALCVLGAGIGIGVASGGGALKPSADQANAGVSNNDPGPVEEESPAADETSDAPESVPVTPADWKIKLKIREKACFGGAGCNVTYQIDPQFVGTGADPADGSYSVTYKVMGGEDGPQISTFTVDGGQASFSEEELISTPSSGTKLSAQATSVDYD